MEIKKFDVMRVPVEQFLITLYLGGGYFPINIYMQILVHKHNTILKLI